MLNFVDSVTLSGVKETQEGYLIADAFTVRTGIQVYAGHEVGRPDMAQVRVYRPESEVFNRDSVQSFSHIPVTNDHPSVAVTADNWKEHAVGETSTDVMRDGERLKIPLILKDKKAIADVKAGKRELSAGYACDLAFESGQTPEGLAYDAVQRHIRANHVAIVKNGRAGHEFRIGDIAKLWGSSPLTSDREFPVMKIVLDGITIDTTEQGAEAINKLQRALSDKATDLANATAAHTKTLADKDELIGELKVKLGDAEKKIPTGADLDKLVADRVGLIDSAKKIAKDIKVEGLSDAEIRKAAVIAKYGEDVVKDSSDAEIAGMFKAAAKDAASATPGTDPYRAAHVARDAKPQITADHGQAAYEKRILDAYKAPASA